jgi:anthranilate phosphoribosyltransferase
LINILDPLTKPALTKRHLVGVYDYQLSRLIAEVMREIGLIHVMAVSGDNGLDEMNICGKTHVVEMLEGDIQEYDLMPEDVGLKTWPVEKLKGGDAQTNKKIIVGILEGGKGAPRDVTIYNAAAALKIAQVVESLNDGIAKATDAIDQGLAKKKLEQMIEISRDL